MIENYAFLVRAFITLSVLMYYMLFLFRRQYLEVQQPHDSYTPLRRYILFILLTSVITLAPSVMYQFIIAFGGVAPWLRNFTSIVGGVNLVATALLLHLVFTYKVRR